MTSQPDSFGPPAEPEPKTLLPFPAAPRNQWHLRTRTLRWNQRPLIMAILNVTPDSFSDGGLYSDPHAALDRALALEANGADLIDVGAESSRPGASLVDADMELARLLPVLRLLRDHLHVPISIDTWKSSVAKIALDEGAEVINDISGGQWDNDLWPTVAQAQAGYVLMHSPGPNPNQRHAVPDYSDIIKEVIAFLRNRLVEAELSGIRPGFVVVDPGFGFGKKLQDNLRLMQGLRDFESLHRPLLVGLSRKSFLKTIGGGEQIEISTLLAQAWASAQGAALWRVHEVSAAAQAARWTGLWCTPCGSEPILKNSKA